ncbi:MULTISPECIES: response regulator [unclassified Virgibacillus]|uniref:response regulator n=1 Tax=unclassified Virgibacillus TaxID=2620237 RepID=UPI0024DE7A9B|nr:response regulator [Virgibacillus sp. LDC-1]
MDQRILIVDDEIGIRLLLEEILTNEGYAIETANTGQEALDKLMQQTFDLLLIDYKLPILDGIEVLEQLQNNDVSIPTILMSGMMESIKQEVEAIPMVKRILGKPFNVIDVCKIVESVFN